MTEAVLISLAGGALGTVAASLLLRGLTQWPPVPNLPIHVTVNADARVYAAALGLSLVSGLLFGLLPARQVWHTSAVQVMKGSTADRVVRRFSLRDLLLSVQIAICTLLVTACFVALRGMQRSLHAPLGFVPDNVTLMRTDMHMAGYTNKNAVPLQKELVARVAAMAGVETAGVANTTPLSQVGNSNAQFFPEHTTDFEHPRMMLVARYYSVGPGYLEAARTRLIAGRNVSWQDTGETTAVALVNETFARRFSAAHGRRSADGFFLGGTIS